MRGVDGKHNFRFVLILIVDKNVVRLRIPGRVGVGFLLRCQGWQVAAPGHAFGSMAPGSDTIRSDVDVMILGSASLRKVTAALRGISGSLGREVNPNCLTVDEWHQRLNKGDAFIRRVADEPKLWPLQFRRSTLNFQPSTLNSDSKSVLKAEK